MVLVGLSLLVLILGVICISLIKKVFCDRGFDMLAFARRLPNWSLNSFLVPLSGPGLAAPLSSRLAILGSRLFALLRFALSRTVSLYGFRTVHASLSTVLVARFARHLCARFARAVASLLASMSSFANVGFVWLVGCLGFQKFFCDFFCFSRTVAAGNAKIPFAAGGF